MKPEGRVLLPEKNQRELENKYDATIKGGMEEENVYDKLRECLKKNNVKNTVVINGWKDKGTGKLDESHPLYREQKEFDFLIVSQPNQTIIHIEVKRTCSESNMRSAKKQLENGLKMFQKSIPFPRVQKWKYSRVIYFGLAEQDICFEQQSLNQSKEEQPFENHCLKCKNFIIGPKTDLSCWWNELIECLSQPITEKVQEQSDDTYLNALRFLLHQMYKQQDCATIGQLIKETHLISDKICTPETIMFWSKEQYKALKDFKDKKVVLTSGFGTGKTILIKAKAKELVMSGQNVVIVIYETTTEKTILRTEYELFFQNEKTATKITSLSGKQGKL
jgi:hypothetical protein